MSDRDEMELVAVLCWIHGFIAAWEAAGQLPQTIKLAGLWRRATTLHRVSNEVEFNRLFCEALRR